MQIMVGVWGVEIHFLRYIEFFASLGLIVSGICRKIDKKSGDKLTILSLIGLFSFFIALLRGLVPQANSVIAPVFIIIILIVVSSYIWLCSKIIRNKKTKLIVLTLIILISIISPLYVYVKRLKMGEYDHPLFAFFEHRKSDDFIFDDDYKTSITKEMRDEIKNLKLTGITSFRGGSGYDVKNKVFIICEDKIINDKVIYYPKNGTVIYWYHKNNWYTIPHDMEFYNLYSTLKTDGMIQKIHLSGGVSSSLGYDWK